LVSWVNYPNDLNGTTEERTMAKVMERGRVIIRPLPKDDFWISSASLKRPIAFMPKPPSKVNRIKAQSQRK
jgi:hypothetical protein